MILIAVISILILMASWYAYKISFFSPKRHRPTPDLPMEGDQYEAVAEHISRISGIMRKFPFEEVTIKSFDGCKLFGRY